MLVVGDNVLDDDYDADAVDETSLYGLTELYYAIIVLTDVVGSI